MLLQGILLKKFLHRLLTLDHPEPNLPAMITVITESSTEHVIVPASKVMVTIIATWRKHQPKQSSKFLIFVHFLKYGILELRSVNGIVSLGPHKHLPCTLVIHCVDLFKHVASGMRLAWISTTKIQKWWRRMRYSKYHKVWRRYQGSSYSFQ